MSRSECMTEMHDREIE
jgi:hypothetical protein